MSVRLPAEDKLRSKCSRHLLPGGTSPRFPVPGNPPMLRYGPCSDLLCRVFGRIESPAPLVDGAGCRSRRHSLLRKPYRSNRKIRPTRPRCTDRARGCSVLRRTRKPVNNARPSYRSLKSMVRTMTPNLMRSWLRFSITAFRANCCSSL